MKVITHRSIEKLGIQELDCFDWAIEGLKKKNEWLLPAKISMKKKNENFCNVMPSIISVDNKNIAGVKIINRSAGAIPSLNSKIILSNYDTGEFLAILDGNWITVMRTAAVAAHSMQLFAKNNYKSIGLIGLGNITRAFMKIILNVFTDKQLDINLYNYKNYTSLFIEDFRSSNFNYIMHEEYASVIKGSDVVVSAPTFLENDIANDKCYSHGILVIPIHTLGFKNCDLFFDKVFCDDINHIKHFQNYKKMKQINEVTDVINNKCTGRENDDERILCYNIGVSIHDIYFAYKIYKMIYSDKSLKEITFSEPENKFWI